MRLLCIALACLLAGCTAPSNEIEPAEPPSFAPQEHRDEDVQGDLSLVVEMEACDEGFCVSAVATKESGTYYVSNICKPAWSETMEKDGKAVTHKEPRFYCAAFGVGEMDAQMFFNTTWDGQVWDDAAGKMVPAEPGAYQWTIHFRAYAAEDGSDPVDLDGTVTVVVGEA